MIISVINHTNGNISDAEVHTAIRVVNRQIAEDFGPQWSLSATLRLEGSASVGHPRHSMDLQRAADMRGEAVIYLWDPPDVQSAYGFHATNFKGIPYGFVYPEIAATLAEDWTVALSHEALEMIADPDVNLLVMGPHPHGRDRTVFHWYEVCDAVQTEIYWLDGVPVSNFVLPAYFTPLEEPATRNDFLNTMHNGETLRSFGIAPGGYAGFFDPLTGRHETAFVPQDPVARHRWDVKSRLDLTRRSQRYVAMGPSLSLSEQNLRAFRTF